MKNLYCLFRGTFKTNFVFKGQEGGFDKLPPPSGDILAEKVAREMDGKPTRPDLSGKVERRAVDVKVSKAEKALASATAVVGATPEKAEDLPPLDKMKGDAMTLFVKMSTRLPPSVNLQSQYPELYAAYQATEKGIKGATNFDGIKSALQTFAAAVHFDGQIKSWDGIDPRLKTVLEQDKVLVAAASVPVVGRVEIGEVKILSAKKEPELAELDADPSKTEAQAKLMRVITQRKIGVASTEGGGNLNLRNAQGGVLTSVANGTGLKFVFNEVKRFSQAPGRVFIPVEVNGQSGWVASDMVDVKSPVKTRGEQQREEKFATLMRDVKKGGA